MISNKSKISLFSLIVYIHCILMFLTWCYHIEVLYHNTDHNEGPDDVCSQQFNEKKLHVSILNFLKWKKPWKLDEKQEAQSKLKMKKNSTHFDKKDLLGIRVLYHGIWNLFLIAFFPNYNLVLESERVGYYFFFGSIQKNFSAIVYEW